MDVDLGLGENRLGELVVGGDQRPSFDLRLHLHQRACVFDSGVLILSFCLLLVEALSINFSAENSRYLASRSAASAVPSRFIYPSISSRERGFGRAVRGYPRRENKIKKARVR